MTKLTIKAAIKSRAKYARDQMKLLAKTLVNRTLGFHSLNIGGGRTESPVGWWCADVQTGTVIDAQTVLPFRDRSIRFAYSSMFFEHIDDETALRLLREVRRVLKPGGTFRIAVPEFRYWIDKYRAGDKEAFGLGDQALLTWPRAGVPVDLEHLLVAKICTLHNKPHAITIYPHLVDERASVPTFMYPFADRFDGFYCGPAPEITTEEIKTAISSMTDEQFIFWALQRSDQSDYKDPTFNSWHKNYWTVERLEQFARDAGHSDFTVSKFGDAGLPESIEPQFHKPYGIYVTLR